MQNKSCHRCGFATRRGCHRINTVLSHYPDIEPRPEYEFRRGFIEFLRISVKSFLRHGETLVERTPLRHVEFTDAGGQMKALANSRALGRLQQLDILMEPLEPSDVAALTRSPHLSQLATLRLHRNGLMDDHLAVLTKAARWENLRGLDLSFNRFGSTAAEFLEDWPVLVQLEELRLFGCNLRNEGAAVLARCPGLTQLRVLDLGGNGLTADAAEFMGAARAWRALEELLLDRNEISAAAARHLLRSPALPSLRHLHLLENRIHPSSAKTLRKESDKVIV